MSNNLPTTKQVIIMAEIGKPYGIKGLNKINPFSEEISALLDYSQHLIKSKDSVDWEPVIIDDLKIHGKKLVGKINNSNTPETAKMLTGKLIGVLKEDLPEITDGNYYYHDLIGLNIINKDNKSYGTLTEIWSNGAHDVFTAVGTKTRVIPFIDSVVLEVNLSKKFIKVDWDYEH